MPTLAPIQGSMILDPSAYIGGLNQAAGATRSFQQGVSTISFAGFNRGIFATTTLLYGLERIISRMSQGMEEYANMLGRIGTVADLTAASVAALADSMKSVSVMQGVSRKDIMGGMYTAAQAGYGTPAEMRAMSMSGAKLSRASGKEIDVKKSVDLMSGIRQALGIGADAISSNRTTDLLLRGRDVGRWELDQMAHALGIPLTVWGNQFAGKQSGEETLRQLVSVMAVASLAGVSPNMTATGTRRLVEKTLQLNKSGKTADPLRNALRGQGFNDPEPIMEALNQGGMKYLNTLMKITGGSSGELTRMGYGSRDLLVLTSALRGKGEKLNQTYEELAYGNTAGTTERYAEKMRGTYDYSRDRLRAQWEITSQQFMQASVPLIGQFTNMLESFNKVAQALPESVKSFMLLLGALSAARLFLNFFGFRSNPATAMMGGKSPSGAISPNPKKVVGNFLAQPYSWRMAAMADAATPKTMPFLKNWDSFMYGNRRSGAYSRPLSGNGARPSGASVLSGLGGTLGSGLGMAAGISLGNALEGENGNGLIPMVSGMAGAQLGNNLLMSYLTKAGNGVSIPARLSSLAKGFLPGAAMMTAGAKVFGGALWDAQTPMNMGEEQGLEREADLRKRSSFAPIRFLNNVWNSLPALGQLIAEMPSARFSGGGADQTWGAQRFSRLWNSSSSSKEGLFDNYVWNELDKGSRQYLTQNKMASAQALMKSDTFRTGFTEQFGAESWRQMAEGNLSQTDPQKWVGQLSDGIKLLSRLSDTAKSKVEQLADAEGSLAQIREVGKINIRPLLGFVSGYETMLGLEGHQRGPFQPERGDEWQNQYSGAYNKYLADYRESRYTDSGLQAQMGGIEGVAGKAARKSAERPFNEVMDWNARLKGMDFLAQYGPYLQDKKQVPDASIIKAFGLDTENMSEQRVGSILGKIRNLDPNDWTKTFEQPKAPFSQALQYGTKEGYNATLERKDNFVVEILAPGLKAIVDAIDATERKNEEKQRTFEDALQGIIEQATQPIVDAINNANPSGSAFPTTG